MTQFEELENYIVERISQELQGQVDVKPLPDDPASYMLKNANGAVLVRYNDGSFTAPGCQVQQAMMTGLEITIKSRRLRGEYGAYDMLEKVKQVVTSMMLGGSRFYIANEMFSHYDWDRKVWEYGQRYILPGIYIMGT